MKRTPYDFTGNNVSPLALKIREILLHDWDPCEVGDDAQMQNEYDAYIDEVMGWVSSGMTGKEIGTKLRHLQYEMFNWTFNWSLYWKVGDMLYEAGKEYR